MIYILFKEVKVKVIFVTMIVKKKEGYFVLSEKTKRNLGGPYKKREEALKRLRQVEYFKHLGKAKG